MILTLLEENKDGMVTREYYQHPGSSYDHTPESDSSRIA